MTTSRLSPRALYGTTLRIYDNGGKTADRYTIIPPRNATAYRFDGAKSWGAPWGWACIVSSPDGHVSGHETATPGDHLGRRIRWDELPEYVQEFSARSFPEFVFDLDTIARHMCIAAVWADCEESTHPRISNKALKTARAYAEAFVSEFPELTWQAMHAEGYGAHPDAGSPAGAFGHDLYMTACGHGVGFWDRSELDENELGDKLSQPLRDDFHKWYLEVEFSRGWLYLSAPITRKAGE